MRLNRIVKFLCVVSLSLIGFGPSAAEEPEPPKLLGRCTMQQLNQEPFAEWFRSGYEEYAPRADFLEALRHVGTDDVRVSIFFGTWCGDSRREVPRWLKLFDAMGFPQDRVELVAVDDTDEANKQSPAGEERGFEVYRLPTVVVKRGGTEIARVVEYPALSIERDLLEILESRPYEPNFVSYAVIRRWLGDGLLGDPNVSPRGMAGEVRHVVSGEGELAAAARVLLSRGDTAEATKLFQVNCFLYRDSSRCQAGLAEALIQGGEYEDARKAAERALQLNDEPERVENLIQLIERSRGEE